MGDLKSPNLIIAKGILFLVLGTFASTLLLVQVADITVALLFLIAVWAFCRFYYFAFYVIQHYVDPEYRFDGLFSFFSYLLRRFWNPTADNHPLAPAARDSTRDIEKS